MRDDATRWNARYDGWAPPEPAPPLGLAGRDVPPGRRCLDVACGAGAQSVWAAQHGFAVTAFDVSDVAVDLVRRTAAAHGVADLVDVLVRDLDEGLPPDLADAFDLVICQRYRDERIYPQLARATAPGGTVVITVLSRVGLGGEGGPYHAPPGELVTAFRELGMEIDRSVEGDGEATLVARRPGP